jgi:hypothetical protein
LLLERKAGEVGGISKERNAVSDIGDYLIEMNIHLVLYRISKRYTYCNFKGFLDDKNLVNLQFYK